MCVSFYLLRDFILFIKVAFHTWSNRTNRSLELLFDIPKYLYALSNLTWAFTWVHKTKSHGIRLSHQVHFKSKIPRNSFRKFYLGLNHGAKRARNTRGVIAMLSLSPLRFYLSRSNLIRRPQMKDTPSRGHLAKEPLGFFKIEPTVHCVFNRLHFLLLKT